MMPKAWLCAVLLLAGSATASDAAADVFRPAYLELRETSPDHYAVLWKVPAQGNDARLAIDVTLPAGTVEISPRQGRFTQGAHVQEWRIRRSGGLVGQAICIEGRAAGATDVLVRLQRRDGTAHVERLPPGTSCFTITRSLGAGEVAWTYGALGVGHILLGFDHLLFVLALVILVRDRHKLIWTITAFTAAHSLTLAAATLGWIHVPTPPVEASIALSIVFLASEILHARAGRPGLTSRRPWIVAFMFGLLHGLGFASALSEIGLPANAIPLSLLFFNVGVEAGQLLFIGAVLLVMAGGRRLPLSLPVWSWRAPAYAIGSIAAFWTLERVASF